MSEDMDSTNHFTKEMIDMAVQLWARSSISLIDVRYKLIYPDKPIQSYRMPTSMLVYICSGEANVKLDHTLYKSDRFGIFHGGKGTELSIHPTSRSLETYMVLYRAETPPFYKREIYRLLEHINPFIQVYGFSPRNPLFFMEKFLIMKDRWNRESVLNQFYSKIVLYHIVYEIYNELEKGDILYFQPDYVVLVKQYLEQHYSEPVSIQQLIEMLPISRSQLVRLFKKRENKSIQEYLNEIRLDSAKRHLQYTNATIQEIAAGCGFVDHIIIENNLIHKFGRNDEPPVMKDVLKKYLEEEPGKDPVYIVFINDGGCKKTIKPIIVESAKHPVFWQFVGIGNGNFDFLKKLDEMEGRVVDNANFLHIENIDDISDEQLYNSLLTEFPSWLKEVKDKGIIEVEVTEQISSREPQPNKSGFWSKLFGR